MDNNQTKLLHISIKMIIAGVVAIMLGFLLNLTFYTTAAAASILSIQWTKRDFINIAVKRLISGVSALIFATALFYLLGQNFYTFTIFLIVFVILSWLLNAPEGIVLSVVLVTHIYITPVSLLFLLEELVLLFISIGVAFIVNMLYPQFNKNEMKTTLKDVDKIIETELSLIIAKLRDTESTKIMIDSKKELESIMNSAKMIDKDLLLQNDHRYITYLYMRNMQLQVLNNISKDLNIISSKHPYKNTIADFLEKISLNISFNNQATNLLEELKDLNKFFIDEQLPKTRQEFEVRAILFQILNEICHFLELKVEFHHKYPNFIEKEDELND